MTVTGLESPLEQDNVSIQCNVRANPRAKVTWLLLKEIPIEITRIISGTRVSITDTSQAMSILQITKATAADTGVYVCVADNGIGSPSIGQRSVTITGEFLTENL